MATLSSIITPTNITTATNTQTLTNKTLTGAAMNGTLGATTPSTVAATTLAVSSTSSFSTSAPTVPGGFMFRNRIINGDMRIDQANAGASLSVLNTGSVFYSADMWYAQANNVGAFSLQQVTDAPTGFVNSLKATVTTISASPATSEFYSIQQRIEGVNVYDLLSGTANAKTVTLSFWVKSSISGTYGVVISNATNSRFYPVSYSISATGTWEKKTITLVLDTTGTWVTDNTKAMNISFNFGVGATYAGTSGAWTGTRAEGVSGQTQLISTLSATFQISGVQLETGSAATPFEVRDYATELVRCQRYYATSIETGATVTNFTTLNANGVGGVMAIANASNNDLFPNVRYPVAMRTNPTLTVYSGANRTAGSVRNMITGTDVTGFSNGSSTSNNMGIGYITGNTLFGGTVYGFHYVANARL